MTVFIPVHNRQRYIATAVDSILAQTFGDFELLVVDDGSTDATLEVLSHYRDPRLRVECNPRNLGLPGTRNRGLELARGEYIALLDSDDKAWPERLTRQVEVLDRHPELVQIGSACDFMDAEGRRLDRVRRRPLAPDEVDASLAFYCALTNRTIMGRTAILREYRYSEDFPSCEDYELHQRLARTWRMANLPDVLVCGREHPGRFTRNNRALGVDRKREICRRALLELGIEPSEADLDRHYALSRPPGARRRTGPGLSRLDRAVAGPARRRQPPHAALCARGAAARHDRALGTTVPAGAPPARAGRLPAPIALAAGQAPAGDVPAFPAHAPSAGDLSRHEQIPHRTSHEERDMRYLDFEALERLDARAFQEQHPYPWANPAGLLTAEGYAALRDSLPSAERFTEVVGKVRRYGQQSHDRLALEYAPGLELSPHWQAFLDELNGPPLPAVPDPHARHARLPAALSLALHAGRLLGLAALRRPRKARIAHLLLQHRGRLASRVGRADPGAGRRRPLRQQERAGLRGFRAHHRVPGAGQPQLSVLPTRQLLARGARTHLPAGPLPQGLHRGHRRTPPAQAVVPADQKAVRARRLSNPAQALAACPVPKIR
ncbi:glycosyltransferase family 2 protein [Azotobacter vinelandii]